MAGERDLADVLPPIPTPADFPSRKKRKTLPSCDLTNAEVMTYLRSRRSKKKGKCDDDDSLALDGETRLLQEAEEEERELQVCLIILFF